MSSSESSSSSTGTDSSSSGSSGSSSSSDSEDYVKKKKSPAKKKQVMSVHHRQQQHAPTKDTRSRSPPPKAKAKPQSPKSRRYSPSIPTRSDSSDRSLSPGRSLTPRLRQARKEAMRKSSPTPEKRPPPKPKPAALYSRSPTPEPKKQKPPPRRDPTPERDKYPSRAPAKDSPYFSKRGRSPSMTGSQKSYSPSQRKRGSLSPRRSNPLPGKDLPPPRSSSDYRDSRDSRGDKYGGRGKSFIVLQIKDNMHYLQHDYILT